MKIPPRIKSHEITKYIPEEVDLFLCSVSYEVRCKIIPTSISKVTKEAIIFRNKAEPFSTGEKQKEENIQCLKSIFGSNTSTIEISKSDPFLLSNRFQTYLQERLSQQLQTIVVDITTFTHEALLIIFKILCHLKIKLDNKVFLIYNYAKEYSYNIKDEREKWLSKGIKDVRTILGYPGKPKPLNQIHLIVLVGFEAERALKLIEEYEPSVLSLGLVKEDEKSIMLSPINKMIYTNLLSIYPDVHKFNFSYTDPIRTKDVILKQAQEFSDYNVVIAPMNNKISTIGVGLAAIENPAIQLCYSSARLYNTEGYSSPSNECSVIEL